MPRHPKATRQAASSPRRSLLNASLLLAGVLLIHNPISTYSSAPSDLEFNAGQLTLVFLACTAVLLAAVTALSFLVSARTRVLLYPPLVALGIAAWLYGQLFPSDIGLLDGSQLRLGLSPTALVAHVALFSTLCALLAYTTWLYPQLLGLVVLVLNAGLLLSSFHLVASENKQSPSLSDHPQQSPRVYDFGSAKNVLIVVMDALQSDALSDVLEENPTIRQDFSGFTFFRNAMGVARTTYLTMPSIYSGRPYQPGSSIRDHMKAAIETSYLTQLATAGIDTTLVNPMMFHCGGTGVRCVTSTLVQGTPIHRLATEAAFLIDVSFLRSLPPFLKNLAYRDGGWLFKNLIRDDTRLSHAARDNAFLDLFGSKISRSETAVTTKFIYLSSTHKPIDLNESCEYQPRSFSRETYKTQIRCAMLSLTGVFRALRRASVYDNTAILLLSDTGVPCCLPNEFSEWDSSTKPWANRAGAANPAFLFKPFNSQGSLASSEAPVQLIDVAATVCELIDGCTTLEGRPLWTIQENESRPRRFLWYEWKHDYWELDTLPKVDLYTVTGRVYRPEDWTLESSG